MKLWFALRSMTLLLAMCPAALASTTWYVDGYNGSDNNNCKSSQHACKTIGHAISLASSGDSIMVASNGYNENLIVSHSLRIAGDSALTTIIDGNNKSTVVSIPNANVHVTLSRLTIQNGHADLGGGIDNNGTLTVEKSMVSNNSSASSGGGIYNRGALTISKSIIDENNSASSGGGIYSRGTLTISKSIIDLNIAKQSAGIENLGKLTINDSTVSRNTADCECIHNIFGGGIFNAGTLAINNSTIEGNIAKRALASFGGGISSNGWLTINNVTLSENEAEYGRELEMEGGTVISQNSIFANSLYGTCLATVISKGYNLSSDNSCTFNGPGDLNNTDPVLGQLGNYGGPTQTIPVLSGSPAIDAGNPSGCKDGEGHLLKTDQRGKPRPDHEDKSGCDMGAYERQRD